MNDAQIWTVIGGFAVLLGLLYTSLHNSMRDLRDSVVAQIGGVRGEIEGLRNEMTTEFKAVRNEMTAEIGGLRTEMNSRFDAIDARFTYEREYNATRFDAVEHRIGNVESDMTIIKGALIGKISA